MSPTMRIRFASDMPWAAVEVLSPNLESIHQVALAAGQEISVGVPSEACFIRVQLPSGRSVSIRHPGDLDYLVSRFDVERRAGRTREFQAALGDPGVLPPKNVEEIREYHRFRREHHAVDSLFESFRDRNRPGMPPAELVGGIRAAMTSLTPLGDSRAPGVASRISWDGRELDFFFKREEPPYERRPYGLRITVDQMQLSASLPGSLSAAYVRVDELWGSGRVISVRVSTVSEGADAVAGYLARGDYYSAATMAPWIGEAADMLLSKVHNPYAAAVGAYLLLRLERFDLMRDWPKNLADWFPFLPDGCVIWAWQSIRERGDTEAGTTYLLEAARRGLPIHLEGLLLLVQGLRLIGKRGEKPLEKLEKTAGRVLWNSPFTVRLEGYLGSGKNPATFDVNYMPTI